MNVFIAGARAISSIHPDVTVKLYSIYEKGYGVLVGDADGVDLCVQKYFANLKYRNVTVYASNGKARNNVGAWQVEGIPVSDHVKGFDFYQQKDIAMANSADNGLMVWNGESKGTLCNIINLVKQDKVVLIYLTPRGNWITIKNMEEIKGLLEGCPASTQRVYHRQVNREPTHFQPALF